MTPQLFLGERVNYAESNPWATSVDRTAPGPVTFETVRGVGTNDVRTSSASLPNFKNHASI
jgi:hypothetical protein